MPVGCIEKSCKDCEFAVFISGVLKCNYENRLGVSALKGIEESESFKRSKALEELERLKKEIEMLEKWRKEK